MSEPAGQPVYVRYKDFLDADPRRRNDALELGTDWRDGDARYRVCWYEQTHELTAERLSRTDPLAIDDFYHGISGPVEILALITNRHELSMILGDWPNIAPNQPRTLAWLKRLLASDRNKPTNLSPTPRMNAGKRTQ